MAHEDWRYLLSTIKAKDNRKSTATQINNIVSLKAASLYDSNKYVWILIKKRASTGARLKKQGVNTPKKHSAQNYCVIFKKA